MHHLLALCKSFLAGSSFQQGGALLCFNIRLGFIKWCRIRFQVR